MKFFKNKLCLFLFSITLLINSLNLSISYASTNDTTNNNHTYTLVLDSDSNNILPDRFRIDDTLNISGSKQFTPNQLPNIKNKINNKNLYIIDLREESHGFINDIAFSFYRKIEDPSIPFTIESVLTLEQDLLKTIKENSTVSIKDKEEITLKNVVAKSILSEPTLSKINNVKYVRLPVIDGYIPNNEVVDNFITLVKNKPIDSHLHFHCKEGEGRTTTFMAMYAMMKNQNNLPLDQILEHQIKIGGINLVQDKLRAEFLQNFYNYTIENTKNNYEIPYSQWIKNK